MRINRGRGCKSYKMSYSRRLRGLSSCRGVLGLVLRPGKDPMDQQLEGNMGLAQGQGTMFTEAMARGTQVEGQLRSLELPNKTTDQCQITWNLSCQEWLDLERGRIATRESNQCLLLLGQCETILWVAQAPEYPLELLALAPNGNLQTPGP